MKTQKLMTYMAGLLTVVATLNSRTSTVFAQGSLAPPGAPAPLMKSLDQIEARTPVDAQHTPGDGAINLYIISQPGSYYLTSNILGVSNKSAIEITANNVVLDLNGFTLLGTSNSRYGIVIQSSTQTNIVVRNGVIRGWVNSYNGIESNARNVVLERLMVSHNTQGISASTSTVIRDCIVSDNAFFGVTLNGSGCVVVNNEFIGNNSLNFGGNIGSIVVLGAQNRIEGNHITDSGPGGYGIYVSTSAGNSNNIVIRNSVSGGGPNNYSPLTNQIVGPLITNTASGIITNSNPWANFSF